MQALFSTLREIAGDESEARAEFVRAVSTRLGPVVMRAKEIVGVSISRIPETFAADLIDHYDVLLDGISVERPFKPVPPPAKSPDAHILSESADAAAAAVEAGASGSPVPVPVPQASESSVPAPQASESSSSVPVPRASESSSLAEKRSSAGAAKALASLDDDERLIDNILDEASEPGATADSNMDFFLKDEDSDGSDDEDDDDEYDSNSMGGSTAGLS
ncbi:hypothetical protein IWW50_005283 [Coemansia erecta]|nr:hypothetical protein IWW50_005283 [Coemansia erecta]